MSELDRVDRLRDFRFDAMLDEDAVPQHEQQQRPELAAAIQRADLVFLDAGVGSLVFVRS